MPSKFKPLLPHLLFGNMITLPKKNHATKLQNVSRPSAAPQKPTVAIVGKYQDGKSTLVNCLLGGEYAFQGDGLTTTKYTARYMLGDMPEIRAVGGGGEIILSDLLETGLKRCLEELPNVSELKITVYSPFLYTLNLMDSPGWSANATDNSTAEQALESSDIFVYVLTKAISEDDLEYLRLIAKTNKPWFVILNCQDDRSPQETEVLSSEIDSKLRSERLDENCHALQARHLVFPVNLLWAQYALRCASPEKLPKIDRRIRAFFSDALPDRGRILSESGILWLRRALVEKTAMMCRLPGVEPLGLLDRTWDLLRSDLQRLLK